MMPVVLAPFDPYYSIDFILMWHLPGPLGRFFPPRDYQKSPKFPSGLENPLLEDMGRAESGPRAGHAWIPETLILPNWKHKTGISNRAPERATGAGWMNNLPLNFMSLSIMLASHQISSRAQDCTERSGILYRVLQKNRTNKVYK